VPELEVGSEFAGYRLEAVAGRGGMGVVYLARNVITDQRRALKVIAPELSADVRFQERFRRESRLAAGIEHSNVIPIYEAREHDGRLLLAMRYVDGTDLSSLLKREGRLPAWRALAIVRQVAAALDSAHARGLVHRDVKPANVLLAIESGSEHAYLTDFGLVKDVASDSSFTSTGMFLGTYQYAAPEQIDPSGGKRVDHRADIYALGCVLYHALAGEVPFPREGLQAVIVAHLLADPPDVCERCPDLPGPLADVIRRAMAKDPDARFASAGALGEAAAAALSKPVPPVAVPPVSAPPTVRERPPLPAPVERTEPALPVARTEAAPGVPVGRPEPTAPRQAKRRRGRRRLAALAAVAVVAAVAVTLAVVLPGGGDDTSAERGGLGQVTHLGDSPVDIALAGGSAWVALTDGTVTRLDGATGEVVGDPIRVGGNASALTLADGSVWVLSNQDAIGSITRIDPTTGAIVGGPIPVGRPHDLDRTEPDQIAAGRGSLWVTHNFQSTEGETVSRVDIATGKTVGRAIEVSIGPDSVAVGGGSVWVGADKGVWRIDAETGKVVGKPIALTGEVAFGDGSLWVADYDERRVWQLNPSTGGIAGASTDLGQRPVDVAVGEGFVWATSDRADQGNEGTVVRIDPRTGGIVGDPIPVGVDPEDLAVGEGAVWVTDPSGDRVARLEVPRE
jgi:serine/threonine-protein kinase